MLHAKAGQSVVVHDAVADVAALLRALDRQVPGLAAELDDPIFNVAVNDEMLLHGVAGTSSRTATCRDRPCHRGWGRPVPNP